MRGKDRKQELAMMVDLAQYYYQVTHAKLPTKRLSEKMKHICNTDSDVANVFFVQFLKYASENKLAEDEELKVLISLRTILLDVLFAIYQQML